VFNRCVFNRANESARRVQTSTKKNLVGLRIRMTSDL